jgi:hypothetical protein
MQRLDYTKPALICGQVYENSALNSTMIQVLTPPAYPIAIGTISAQEIRLQTLLGYRNLFAALSAIAVIASGLCAAYDLSWEPAVALLFCLLGLAVVFELKIREAK